MLRISVKTLDGHLLEVQVSPAGTVRDIKKYLLTHYQLTKCALYLQARQLPPKATLFELQLHDGDVLTALTTRGPAVGAGPCNGASPAASPVKKAAGGCGRVLDTLLPGYASRPNPSPIKAQHASQQKQPDAAAQQTNNQHHAGSEQQSHPTDSSGALVQPLAATAAEDAEGILGCGTGVDEPGAAAASGGGFVLSGGGAALPGYQGSSVATEGMMPTYNSSRKRQGRTLLQQHIMMQHDKQQHELLAALQQQRLQQDTLQQQQHAQHDEQQQQQQQQQHPAEKQLRQPQGHTCEQQQQQACQQLEHLLQAEPVQGQPQDSQQQQQQRKRHKRQQLDGDSLPLLSRLHHPALLSRQEQTSLLDLPLPAALQQLLVLHQHMAGCYSFLLQQHIQPRWGRLAEMFASLFPQNHITLQHVILMSQLAPRAVVLLLPPRVTQQVCSSSTLEPQQQQQRFGPTGDQLWQPKLTPTDLGQLQQDLQHRAAVAQQDQVDEVASHLSDAGQQQAMAAVAAAAAAGTSTTAWAEDYNIELQHSHKTVAALPAGAADVGFELQNCSVLLVDPGFKGRIGPGATSSLAVDEDEGEVLNGYASITSSVSVQQTGSKPISREVTGYGSGTKTAAARRLRWMRTCVAGATLLVHTAFLQQLQQGVPAKQQCWCRQGGGESMQQMQPKAGAAVPASAVAHAVATSTTGAIMTQKWHGKRKRQPQQSQHKGSDKQQQQQQQQDKQQQQEPQKQHQRQQEQQEQACGRRRRTAAAEQGQDQVAAPCQTDEGAAAQQTHDMAEAVSAAVRGDSSGARRSQRLRKRAAAEGPSTLLPDQQSSQQAHGSRDKVIAAQQRRWQQQDDSGDKHVRQWNPEQLSDFTNEHSNGHGTCKTTTGKSADSSNSESWDVVTQRSWHPLFDSDQVPLPDLVAAVAEHQAHQQHQQQQQQQQSDDEQHRKHSHQGQDLLARPTRTLARHKTCTSCGKLGPVEFLAHLQTLSWYQQQVAHVQHMPARLARHCGTTNPLSGSTKAALTARGIQELFIHQAAAVDALCHWQKHVVIATSTASGKSLCYNVPMLEALARDPQACGLFMFPTKALAQDQLRVLRQLLADAFGQDAPCVEVYDGDTPQEERPAIRKRAQLLITNPDMLHQSILPCHSNFTPLLAKLTLVVVDEGHAYKGVFGCHTALVLRRLRRVCSRAYGQEPRFVVTSATIANPLQHAGLLLGLAPQELLLIAEDGSPHGPKEFVLWNPPLTVMAKQVGYHGGTWSEAEKPTIVSDTSVISTITRLSLAMWVKQTCEARKLQALAAGSEVSVPSRTEWRGASKASRKLQREMARAVARESTAARRRGVALSPAVGVTQDEWTAAVKLGHAAAAAKAFLFDKQPRSLSPGGTGAATAVDADTQLDSDVAEDLNSQEQKQPAQKHRQVSRSRAKRGLFSGASVAGHKASLLETTAVQAKPAEQQLQQGPKQHQRQTPSHPQVAQQQEEAAVAAGSAAGSAGRSKHRIQQLAREALAAVAGAADPGSSKAAPAGPNRRMKRCIRTAHMLDPAMQSGGATGVGPGGSINVLATKTPAAADLQHQIEEALPPRGNFKERFGAAGTPIDQRRDSPIVEMSLLLSEAVMHGLRTIAFCKSRKLCELVAAYTRENLKAAAPHKADMVKVYRAGYSPVERRQIEADLHSGALTAVAATNALELGIDVGSLDLTLHLGFPGSVASLWQQAGRAGRRSQHSVGLYVAFDGPLDQHFMMNPHELFQRPIECVQLDPCNAIVLNSHLVCAAKEVPLLQDLDGSLFGDEQLAAATAKLVSAGLLGRHSRDPAGLAALHCTGPTANPAADISLRTIDPERFIIYNTATNSVLEEIEANMAFYEIYDGAIYMFQGHTYICTSLNLETRVAQVRPVDVHWYTMLRDYTDVHVTGGRVAYPTAHAALAAIAARREVSKLDEAVRGKHSMQQQNNKHLYQGSHNATDTKDATAGLAKSRHDAAAVRAGAAADNALQTGAHAASSSNKPSAMAVVGGGGASNSEAAAAVPVATGAACESCVITVRFMGYFRVHQGSGTVFDAIDLFLPDTQFETQACYLRLPPSARRACQDADIPFREAVHAASHALLNVLPLYMVCNSTDMGTECDNPYDTRFRPERLLLYDKHPGGIGLAAQATPLFPELLKRALDLVQNCSCGNVKGCPCCVQHLDCKNYNAVINKAGAVLILQAALEQGTAPMQAQFGEIPAAEEPV